MRHPTTPGLRAALHAAPAVVLSVLVAGAAAADRPIDGVTPVPPGPASQRFEKEGLAVELSVRPVPGDSGDAAGPIAGGDAEVAVRVTDARSGEPITGLHPLAWISSRLTAGAPSEAECRRKIGVLAGGRLTARAEVDLNTYLLLTLNHDETITLINPQVAFNVTKLEGIVTLPGRGADWALDRRERRLYVTLPDRSAVAVADTATRRLVRTVPTGEGTRPTRIAVHPNGRHAWVGLDGSPTVAVLDTGLDRVVKTVPVGPGRHTVAFTPDGSLAYVTNSETGTVSVIDAGTFTRLAEVEVGQRPVRVAYSPASGLAYAAATDGKAISVIDPRTHRVVKRVPTGRGVVALRFAPGGRFGFAVNRLESTVSVLDAATDAVVGRAAVVEAPDQVVFTRLYAYVRGAGASQVSLIGLAEAAEGRVTAVNVTAGQSGTGAAPAEVLAGDMIAPTPEGNSVMIASGPDAAIYYYVEGMMAPMGTLTNYKRRPHGLLLLDRSLSEVAPGVYATPTSLPAAGRYDVPVLIDQPRLVTCLQLDVAGGPRAATGRGGPAIAVEALFDGERMRPGEAVPLRFRVTDPTTGRPVAGLGDLEVLAFEPPGRWQRRQWATEVGGGVYEVRQIFPRAGRYSVMVRAASRGLGFGDLRPTVVPVLGPAPGGEARAPRGGEGARE